MIRRMRIFLLFLVGVSTPIADAVLFEFVLPISMSKIVTALLLGLVLFQWVVQRRRFVRDSKNRWVVAFAVIGLVAVPVPVIGLVGGAVIGSSDPAAAARQLKAAVGP